MAIGVTHSQLLLPAGADRAIIYRAGDDVSAFYIILDGRVLVLDAASDPGRSDLHSYKHYLRAGDAFGEEAVLSLRPEGRNKFAKRQGFAVQVSSVLKLAVIRDGTVLESISVELQGLPLGVFIRPQQLLSALMEPPEQRHIESLRVIERAMWTVGVLCTPEMAQAMEVIAQSARCVRAAKGDPICSYDQPAEHVFIILSGRVALYWQVGENGALQADPILEPAKGPFIRRRVLPHAPGEGQPHHHDAAAAAAVDNKPAGAAAAATVAPPSGALAFELGEGCTVGSPQEGMSQAREGVPHAHASNSHASQRRFVAAAAAECQLLAMPAAPWATLHASGGFNLARQVRDMHTKHLHAKHVTVRACIKNVHNHIISLLWSGR